MGARLYEEVWTHPEYRNVAPGQHHAARFCELTRATHENTVMDFGAGTGRGALAIHMRSGAAVTMVDFATNCLDDEVRPHLGESFRFLEWDLKKPIPERADFGFCTDVLEHVEPENVEAVLFNIAASAKRLYLNISTVPDVMGALVGEPLHLTVQDPFWWHDRLEALGFSVRWSHYDENSVTFYGTGYADGEWMSGRSVLNVEVDRVYENIRKNLTLGLQEVSPHGKQDQVVYLLAGGPSLNDHEEQILEAGRSGTPIVTVNGTYNWLLERGIKPAAQVMVDAREFNKRFVTPQVDTCKYLIGSQCDHETLKTLPKDRTWLWHSDDKERMAEILEQHYKETGEEREAMLVPGGTTVVTRALCLLVMLGWVRVEVFGWDSCLREKDHHAYAQPENDTDKVWTVTVGGRQFRCHGWMVVQAHDVQRLVRHTLSRVPEFEMIVHGDGLIAHLMNTAAERAGGVN